MTEKQLQEEGMLFAILAECLCQQVNMLEGAYKHNAKRLVNNLIAESKRTLHELKKQWPPEAKEQLENMYDFFYMVVRHASEVKVSDTEAFLQMLKDFAQTRKVDEMMDKKEDATRPASHRHIPMTQWEHPMP